MKKSFVLKANICYSKDLNTLEIFENSYLVCIDGLCEGIFKELPENYKDLPFTDYGDKIIIPGLTDLHAHAPQFAFRGLGMDLELLDWLETHTFPEESKYIDLEYAKKAYEIFIKELRNGPNTRSCIFGTIHIPATNLLMDLLEESGIVSMVGKVNMDRNSPDYLREENAEKSISDTRDWLNGNADRYKNTMPILTPRFIPSCTDNLMKGLKEIQQEYDLPVQSHLSENQGEISWVSELCPWSEFYGDAYDKFGMFGKDTKTIMAHCVWSDEKEMDLIKENEVYVAHCPQSNENLLSGIAPVRKFLDKKIKVGLGSDMAGGSHLSIFRAMSDAIQVSKLYWRLVDQKDKPLSVEEVFYLGTAGSGSFFGKVGKFDTGYEFDAVVLDDTNIETPLKLDIKERLARIIYFSDNRNVFSKYVRGIKLF